MRPHRPHRVTPLAAVLATAALLATNAPLAPIVLPASADVSPVYVVLFTHVEDNTPGGILGSMQSQQNYLVQRANLIAMADLALGAGVQWTLQPDWKLLEAALLYEDAALQASTGDKNFLRYLREDLGVVIDPHSHENGGYNYTDVAHLLDSLGVGATSVIGGHVWDPSLPQFQAWDRFRTPVIGEHYPGASWRGDILIGSGTPNHVNDPILSGVWRPRDRDHYFEHDPAANIAAIGSYKKSIASIAELVESYRSGTVPPTAMLTFGTNINPATLGAPGGLAAVADTVIAPLVAWRDSGLVVLTDFTSLIATWETTFGAFGYVHDAEASVVGVPAQSAASPAALVALAPAAPNPVSGTTLLRYALGSEAHVRLSIVDVRGREVAVLVDGQRAAGAHVVTWDARPQARGVYVCRLVARRTDGIGGSAGQARKLIIVR